MCLCLLNMPYLSSGHDWVLAGYKNVQNLRRAGNGELERNLFIAILIRTVELNCYELKEKLLGQRKVFYPKWRFISRSLHSRPTKRVHISQSGSGFAAVNFVVTKISRFTATFPWTLRGKCALQCSLHLTEQPMCCLLDTFPSRLEGCSNISYIVTQFVSRLSCTGWHVLAPYVGGGRKCSCKLIWASANGK